MMKFLPTQARVRVAPPADVTTIGQEDDPAAGGLTEKNIQQIWKNVERLYKTGLYPAIQISMFNCKN